jgi:hypothetical protein
VGEDGQSVVQNPGFANPASPADDFSLPHGSPGAGFVVFDPSQAGRSNPQIPSAGRAGDVSHENVRSGDRFLSAGRKPADSPRNHTDSPRKPAD